MDKPKRLQKEPRFIDSRSLEKELEPPRVDRLLRKDIERKQSVPTKITEGARISGDATLLYWTNASAGTVTKVIPLNLETVPLVLAWYLGSVDKTRVVVDDNASSLTSSVTTPIYSGANAGVSWDKDNLTFTITSTNVGDPLFKDAYFYYAVYYDDNDLGTLGL